MKHLTKEEFLSTVSSPMKRLDADALPPCEFWSYFDAIPGDDFEGHDCSTGEVEYAWEASNGDYQHVLVDSEDKNVFMVIVLDVANKRVLGHRLLNLNDEYEIDR